MNKQGISLSASILIFVITIVFGTILGSANTCTAKEFDWCGFVPYEDGEKVEAYDYGSKVRARFIFIGFPEEYRCNSNDLVDPLIHQGLQSAVIDSMRSWLKSHSHGNLELSADTNEETGIVYVPGSNFSSGPDALSWFADLCPTEYREVATDTVSSTLADYRCKWGFEAGICTPEAELGAWLTTSEQSYIWSEILFKIYDAYERVGKLSKIRKISFNQFDRWFGN